MSRYVFFFFVIFVWFLVDDGRRGQMERREKGGERERERERKTDRQER